MRIQISTGVFPPQIGGPAQYSANLLHEFQQAGHQAKVVTFSIERYLPPGIRHAFFFLKVLSAVARADAVLVLDTFSVGFPTTLACWLLGKRKVALRTGGDFLWESYLERVKQKVLLRNFYDDPHVKLNLKERVIFYLVRWTLAHVARVIFSTAWQRDLFLKPYGISPNRAEVIENCYGPRVADEEPAGKVFMAQSRGIFFKNIDILHAAFTRAQQTCPDIVLDVEQCSHSELREKMRRAYAVMVISLGEISPNFVMEALTYNRPFILSKENGVATRLADCGIFVDPLNVEEIAAAIVRLCDPQVYQTQRARIREFNFVRTWGDVASDILSVFPKL